MKYQYKHIGIGGTFDHFHAGHESLLKKAFSLGQHVSIGIATDILLEHKEHKISLQSYTARKDHIKRYLNNNNLYQRATIFPLTDIFGIAGDDKTLDAIIVSAETKANAKKINEFRKKKNLSPLKIITIPFVKGNDNKIVRSRRIRRGIVDKAGTPYLHQFHTSASHALPHHLRDSLRNPLGLVIEGTETDIKKTATKAVHHIKKLSSPFVITVGDIATESLRFAGIEPHLSIIDFKTRRNSVNLKQSIPKKGFLINPPGTIQQTVVKKIHAAITEVLDKGKSKQLIIRGEEDLLALPAILLAPLHAVVIYGQYSVGLVLVEVTPEMKEKIAEIVRRFE